MLDVDGGEIADEGDPVKHLVELHLNDIERSGLQYFRKFIPHAIGIKTPVIHRVERLREQAAVTEGRGKINRVDVAAELLQVR